MIVNLTEGRSNVCYPYVYWNGLFSDEELNEIIKYCENNKLEDAKVQNSIVKETRKSKINFTNPDEENRWIFERLNSLVDLINDKFYGFDLIGYEAFQFSTYNAKENGHYNWHIDAQIGGSREHNRILQRKLSMTLLLNDDFEGGDFEINLSQPQKIEIKKGMAIFFPTFILHRVTPVTKGIRKSLVIWVEGPRWK